MRRRRSFLMMRTRGISGPMFRHHTGWRRIVKSIGNAWGAGGPLNDQTLRAIQGWTGFENCYEPVEANFAGNTALARQILQNTESDMTTVSMWLYVPTGTANQKVFDIGDNGAATETTRLRFDVGGLFDVLISNFTDLNAWDIMASVTNMTFVADSFNHIFLSARNGASGGPELEVWINGALAVSGNPNPDITWAPDSTIDFRAGDQVVIGARHNLTQHFIGRITDIWSSSSYMNPAENVPFFYSPTTKAGWPNGTPKDISNKINGKTATTFMGGRGYTIADWNNGLNKGSLGDYTLDGDPIT